MVKTGSEPQKITCATTGKCARAGSGRMGCGLTVKNCDTMKGVTKLKAIAGWRAGKVVLVQKNGPPGSANPSVLQWRPVRPLD